MRFRTAIPTGAASLLMAGSIIACDGGDSCGDLAGASAPCPVPVYGYARVEGVVLHADGAPAEGKQAFVECGRGGFGFDDATDTEGRFVAFMEYASHDTIAAPLPPRDADGSFDVDCEAHSPITPDVVARESLNVRFTPPGQGIVVSSVELRAPTP
jgi:hypothetical protein